MTTFGDFKLTCLDCGTIFCRLRVMTSFSIFSASSREEAAARAKTLSQFCKLPTNCIKCGSKRLDSDETTCEEIEENDWTVLNPPLTKYLYSKDPVQRAKDIIKRTE